MKNVAVIATHHKTGTVWMRTVFQTIARRFDLKFMYIKQLGGCEPDALLVPSIIFADHSDFSDCRWISEHSSVRLFHLIRDPRDVVVSAMYYHRTASERWLHKPKPAFDGLTYQEKINSLADDQARFHFEMRHSAKKTIKAMRRWSYNRENTFEGKYEDLIIDSDMKIFTKILLHLGFEEGQLDVCRCIFQKKSLFGNKDKYEHSHVRSGAREQWKTIFNTELANDFIDQFGNVLVELGYEVDNAWAEGLQPFRKVDEA